MAKKKPTPVTDPSQIVHAPATPQPITETIEKNYMPYVMSVIISRAIPEIDGLKPSHRKLLYTMYKMGLLTGGKTKSANIVGQTMKLNPHGDAAIYETMVRLTRSHNALLHPLIDSKGTFGDHYTGDKYAAARYTEAKLDPICNELFSGIDKDAVDMIDNYDSTMKEPVLLPTTFPNILVTPNMGIAVGMASNICSFNLAEVCDGAIALLRNPKTTVDKLLDVIKAPDFSGGGYIVYDRDQMRAIYETGQGSFRVRSRYHYDKSANCIEVLQIPYSTTIPTIESALTPLVKDGKIKEIVDFRDESDINGLKFTIDLRRGTDPDALMNRLYKLTPLEDSFKCNFNVLINSAPRQLGVLDILKEWILFRTECVRRELNFELKKKRDRLHLITGLSKVLLNIDEAVRIIRRAETDEQVITDLMSAFSLDEIQAEYIANIKLRNLNKKYILNNVQEATELRQTISDIEATLADDLKIRAKIAAQLQEIKKKYGKPRNSQIIDATEIPETTDEAPVENYPVRLVLTTEGYFKKITFQSLQGSARIGKDEQKLKDGDTINQELDAENKDNLLIFTDKANVYRVAVDSFDTTKASAMGDFLSAKLGMDKEERPIYMQVQNTYGDDEHMVFIYENGKGVRVPLKAYETQGNQRKSKKLKNAYSTVAPLVGIFYEKEPFEIMIQTNANRAIIFKSSQLPIMSTRTSGGNLLMTFGRREKKLVLATKDFAAICDDGKGFRKNKFPATGVPLGDKDEEGEQLSLRDKF